MSSKGYIVVDEKKKKRMISNRESAKRSRMKKEQHMKDLNDQIFYYTRKRDEMVMKIEKTAKGYAAMENENMVLRSQKQELEKRLEYANNVCGWCEGDDGNEFKSSSTMGVVVQEPWIRAWDQYQLSNTFSTRLSAGILTDY